jgi:Carboxypeptidase regulatory-like domain
MSMRLCVAVLSCLILGSYAWAQSVSNAQITGTVQDSAGATVPSAEVKAINTGTGLTRIATTAADGRYVMTELPVGPYQLEVTWTGR